MVLVVVAGHVRIGREHARQQRADLQIRLAARDYDPSRINRYAMELAGDFHRFYAACRIKGAEPELLAARLRLADCVRRVIAISLSIAGVTAPEKM